MIVRRITDPAVWDEYVNRNPGAQIFHRFRFGAVIRKTYSYRPVYLACVEKSGSRERIRGILPLFRFNPLFGPRKFVSIPFFDQAGILADNEEACFCLLRAAFAYIRDKKKRFNLELRQENPLPAFAGRSFRDVHSRVFTQKVGLKLPLEPTEHAMLASFKAKLRSQIRKASKNGLTARIGKNELIEPFYNVFSRNMRDLGSPVHAKSFFHRMFDFFFEQSFILVVYHGKIPAAAGFVFTFKDRLINPWASSLKPYRHLSANMLLYWSMIRFACRLKIRYFDMGRSSKNASTYRFKKQWGPEEKPLYWYTFSTDGEFNRAGEERLVMERFQHMPVAVANSVGPYIRRTISL